MALRALTDHQIEKYLENEEILLAAVKRDEQLRDMLRTPLLMSLFAYAYHGVTPAEAPHAIDLRSSPSEIRDRIVDQFVTKCFDWEIRKRPTDISFNEFVSFCSRLAFDDAARSWGRNLIEAKQAQLQFFDLAWRTHILVRHLPRFGLQDVGSVKIYRFIHLLVRDYFAFRMAVDALCSTSIRDRSAALSGLEQMPDVRAPRLIFRFLGDRNDGVKYHAVAILANKRTLDEELLEEHLHDAVAGVRTGTIEVVERRRSRLMKRIPDSLADPDAEVRSAAARACGRLQLVTASVSLQQLVSDRDAIVRANVAYALGQVGNPTTAKLLVPLLSDSEDLVRLNAVAAILRSGSREDKALAQECISAHRRAYRARP